MRHRPFVVYILANRRRTVLYVGVTRDLRKRLLQHRSGAGSRFAHRYHADRLVFVVFLDEARAAIARAKLFKAGSRARKVAAIVAVNPGWEVLGARLGL